MMALDRQMAINELVWISTVGWKVESWSQNLFGRATCVGVIGRSCVFIPLSFSIGFHWTILALLVIVFSLCLREITPSIRAFPLIWFSFFFSVKVNSLTLLNIIPLLRVVQMRWTEWVVGESCHGDHIRSIHHGSLLQHDVPGAYPSLYSRGGGSGHHSSEVVGGIARKGR